MTSDAAKASGVKRAQVFWTEYKMRILHPVTLGASFAGTMLFTVIGPFGTYESDPFLFRLIFWAGVVWSSTFLSLFFGVAANIAFDTRPFWFRSAISGAAFSLFYFALMWFVLTSLYPADSIPPPIELFAVIVSISAFVYIVMWFFSVMVDKQVSDQSPSPENVQTQPAPLANGPAPSHPYWAEYRARLFDPINLTTCALAALVFAVVGPFGAVQSEPFLLRLLFWAALVWTTSMVTLAFGVWANMRYATRPFWFQSQIGSAVFSALYLFLIWIALRAFYPPGAAPNHYQFYGVTVLTTSFLYVAMWSFAYMIESRLVTEQTASESPEPINANPPPDDEAESEAVSCPEKAMQTFLKRLGVGSGTRLIRLAMSDHYIEAHTDTGMHLVYMRFADALEELAIVNGAHVHRSHWVCLDEVESVQRDGTKHVFIMSDGSTVPISRGKRKDLQDAGILSPAPARG